MSHSSKANSGRNDEDVRRDEIHASKLPGAGRADVVRVAAGLEFPGQAEFLEQALALLVERHATSPYANVKSFGRMPAGITPDGTMEIAVPVDHVFWTEQVGIYANRDDLADKRRLLLNDEMSGVAKAGFEAAGWEVLSRL